MNRMRVLLFIVFLCLINTGVIFAESINLGEWDINHPNALLSTEHYTHNLVYSDGTQRSFSSDSSYPMPHYILPSFPDIIENMDGSIYGTYCEPGFFQSFWHHTLTGRMTANSITFQITSSNFIDTYTDMGWGGDKHYKQTHTETTSFSGSISGHTITGTLKGYYFISNETEFINAWFDGYGLLSAWSGNTSGGPFTDTFSINLYVPPIVPRQVVQPVPPSDSQFGKPSDLAKSAGDPINSVTGNMYVITPDLTIPSPGINFSFVRTYNNQADQTRGPLGYGWTHSYNAYLSEDTTTNLVKIKDGEAKGYLFALNTDGTFTPQWGEYSTLTKNTLGFIWTKKNGKAYIFDLSGRLIQIKDRNNNTVNLSYNNQNELTVITDTCGRQVTLSYNAQGRLAVLTDALRRTVTYSYDTQDNLVKVTDPLGNINTYEYDANHNIAKKTDPLGKTTEFTYDNLNRCTSSSGENNLGFTTLSFDPDNKKTTITDSKGNITTQYYNDDLLIVRSVNAQGKEIISAWDPNMNLIMRSDELYRGSVMEHDSKGNLIKVTGPDGNVTQFTYEPNFNLLASSTDALGNVTTYTRDIHGNPTKITDAYQNSTLYTYNARGQVAIAQNALGNTTYFSYDAQGNLTQTKDAQGNITTLSYDEVGNPVQSTDSRGNITSFEYDNLNRLTEITYADGSSVKYAYDAVGNRISVTDTDNNTTDYSYDQDHQIVSTVNALGYTVTNTYDTEGNLTSVTDQNNNETTYEYDGLNHLILKIDAMGNQTKYQYDAAGNRTSIIDAKGQTTNFQYDSLNRLAKVAYPTSQVSYTYDALGGRTTMADTSGTTTYTYDNLSRLIQVIGPGTNNTISYTYDKVGNRLSMTDPDGKVTTYTYDSLNRLSSVTDPLGKVTNYTYDSLSNLATLTYPNSTKEIYLYDNLNHLTKLTQQKTSSPVATLSQLAYTYDNLGRRTRIDYLDGSYVTYNYDALGQLLNENKITTNGSSAITYQYDPAGNRIHMLNQAQGQDHVYIYDSLNQLIEEDVRDAKTTKITVTGTASDPTSGVKAVTVNGITAIFSQGSFSCPNITLSEGSNTITVSATDNAGNSATKEVHVTYIPQTLNPATKTNYTYDNNGNLISKASPSQTVKLTYDVRNMLTHYTAPSVDQTYQYDGDGRRIATTSGSSTTKYLYDGMNVILERNSSGLTTNSYIRNPDAPGGIGGIIYNQTSQYYHYDGLGSVINLTSPTAAIAKRYFYDAYGNVTKESGIAYDSHRFLTKESDATGLIYFGARYYDPQTGRFITQDPSGMVDGPNLYVYCRNNPVNFVDVWGLCKTTPWWQKLQRYLSEVGSEMENDPTTNMQDILGGIGNTSGAVSNIGIIPKAVGYSNSNFLQGGRIAYSWANQYGNGVKFYSWGAMGVSGSALSVASAFMSGWTVGATFNAYYWGWQDYKNKYSR